MVKSCHFHLPLVFGDELMIIKMNDEKKKKNMRTPEVVFGNQIISIIFQHWDQPLCVIVQC